MSRTNLILVVIGLLGCVALSLMMESALKVRGVKVGGPVAAAVDAAFGVQLTAASRFRIDTADGRPVGTLTLQPVLGTHGRSLAARAGEKAWLALDADRIQRLVVVVDPGVGAVERFEVAAPWRPGERVVQIVDGPRRARVPRAVPQPNAPEPAVPPAGR